MTAFSGEESAFRFKGIWWTEEAFTDVLQKVAEMHRAMSNHRVAFHFGASEKAIRMLRARSSTADKVIRHFIERARLCADIPARYQERDWYRNPPSEPEARKILAAAEAERERQWTLRRQHRRRGAAGDACHAERARARKREQIQQCKLSGLTQALTAESLVCSVRTVRRYW